MRRAWIATLVAGGILIAATLAAIAHLPKGEAWAMLGVLVAGAGGWLYLERKDRAADKS